MRTYVAIAALVVSAASFAQFHQYNGPIHTASIDLSGGVTSQADVNAWVYDNTTTFTGYAMTVPAADDLSMTGSGYLDMYKIGYSSPTVTSCVTHIWDLHTGNYLGGFQVDGLNAGAWIYTITVAPTLHVSDYILFSQEYSATGAGALIFDPPTIGSSQDYLLDMSANQWVSFGGNPVANLYTAVHVVPEPGTIATLVVGMVGLLSLRRRK